MAVEDLGVPTSNRLRWRRSPPEVDNLHTRSENERDCVQEDRLPTKPALPIRDMEQRHVGLTKSIADSYTEAAGVCLDRHHESPTGFDSAPERVAVGDGCRMATARCSDTRRMGECNRHNGGRGLRLCTRGC